MQLSSKALVLRALLEQGNVYLHLDPTRPGVEVPSYLKDGSTLTLVIGPDLAVPIPDLEIGPEGISATLSFSRTPYLCVVPWSSLFAMSTEDGRSLVWAEDAPAEIREALEAEQAGDLSGETEDVSGSVRDLVPGTQDVGLSAVPAEPLRRHEGWQGKESGAKGPDRSLFAVVEGSGGAEGGGDGASSQVSAAGRQEPLEEGAEEREDSPSEGKKEDGAGPHLRLVD